MQRNDRSASLWPSFPIGQRILVIGPPAVDECWGRRLLAPSPTNIPLVHIADFERPAFQSGSSSDHELIDQNDYGQNQE